MSFDISCQVIFSLSVKIWKFISTWQHWLCKNFKNG